MQPKSNEKSFLIADGPSFQMTPNMYGYYPLGSVLTSLTLKFEGTSTQTQNPIFFSRKSFKIYVLVIRVLIQVVTDRMLNLRPIIYIKIKFEKYEI